MNYIIDLPKKIIQSNDQLYYTHDGLRYDTIPLLDNSGKLCQNRIPICHEGVWELLDQTGNPLFSIPCSYCHSFQNGLAVVIQGEQYGYIDTCGNFAIPPIFDGAASFFTQYAFAKQGRHYGTINRTGSFITEPLFDKYEINPFDGHDINCVCIGSKWGYVDKEGKLSVPCCFDKCHSFQNGYASVYTRNKWGLIEANGEFVIEPQYDDMRSFADNLLPVCITDNYYTRRWGYINPDNQFVIPAQFEDAHSFENGVARVRYKGHNRLIDTHGNFMPSPAYDNVHKITANHIVFTRNHQWGVADRKGNILFEPQYDITNAFENGLVFSLDEHTTKIIYNGASLIYEFPICIQFVHKNIACFAYDSDHIHGKFLLRLPS